MNKKTIVSILCFCVLCAAGMAGTVEFYVSPQGSDLTAGTKDAPFKTIERARDAAREADKSKPGETVVWLRGGTYSINETIQFDARDSGTEDHPVIYRACPGEMPVISGGKVLSGWIRGSDGVWQAPVGNADFRQLYVNGTKALRSRSPNPGEFLSIVRWDKETREIIMPPGSFRDWQNFDEIEIYLQMQWSVAVMRLESCSPHPEGFALTVSNPERDLVFKRLYPKKLSGQYYHLENALEFIDQPGEWCLNRKAGVCFYRPRSDEDMTAISVIVPDVETLVAIQGTFDSPVRNLQFEGLTFMYSNWTRPSHKGYLNVQAGQYSIEPTDGNVQFVARPPAAVYAACVQNLKFRHNVFKKLGSVGLDIHYGSQDSEVVGNVFYDIAGSGISVARLSDPDVEIHAPYNPDDPRDRCVNDWIHNNYVQSVGFEYGGAIGILAGYATGIRIEHNELRDLAYSGISLGWGWTDSPNAMRDNRICRNHIDSPMTLFSDGGGIYTLSEMPGSLIDANYVTNVKRSKWADPHTTTKCYYLDERSGGITFSRNLWADAGQAVERTFFHQPGDVHITSFKRSMYKDVKTNAGLEPEYEDIKKLAVD